MKKTLKVTTLMMTALMAASTASTTMAATASSATTTGKVSITAGSSDKPTDPEDPDDPGTGNKGPLSLDTVPSFDFGSKELSGGDTVFNTPTILGKDGSYTNRDAHVQVTDVRGTGAGWTLNVQYSDAKGNPINGNNSAWLSSNGDLKGVSLAFPAAAWSMDVAGNKTDGQPSVTNAIGSVNNSAQAMAVAKSNEGMGTWLGTMKQSDISLTVPQGNKVGDYTANLLWTVNDAPQA